MAKPDVAQLGPGYTKAAQIGRNTVFFGEGVVPKIMSPEGQITELTEGDWLRLRSAEDKRRARAERNRGLN